MCGVGDGVGEFDDVDRGVMRGASKHDRNITCLFSPHDAGEDEGGVDLLCIHILTITRTIPPK